MADVRKIRIRHTLLTGEHPAVKPGVKYAEGRSLFVADVLLHEMVHQYHQEITGQTEEAYSGHGPAFRDKANEIGAKLGLPPVRTAKKRGQDKELSSCAQWPHCVRPDGYYKGALADDDSTSRVVKELINAAQRFARHWPDDAEGDPLARFPPLLADERKRLLALFKVARKMRSK